MPKLNQLARFIQPPVTVESGTFRYMPDLPAQLAVGAPAGSYPDIISGYGGAVLYAWGQPATSPLTPPVNLARSAATVALWNEGIPGTVGTLAQWGIWLPNRLASGRDVTGLLRGEPSADFVCRFLYDADGEPLADTFDIGFAPIFSAFRSGGAFFYLEAANAVELDPPGPLARAEFTFAGEHVNADLLGHFFALIVGGDPLVPLPQGENATIEPFDFWAAPVSLAGRLQDFELDADGVIRNVPQVQASIEAYADERFFAGGAIQWDDRTWTIVNVVSADDPRRVYLDLTSGLTGAATAAVGTGGGPGQPGGGPGQPGQPDPGSGAPQKVVFPKSPPAEHMPVDGMLQAVAGFVDRDRVVVDFDRNLDADSVFATVRNLIGRSESGHDVFDFYLRDWVLTLDGAPQPNTFVFAEANRIGLYSKEVDASLAPVINGRRIEFQIRRDDGSILPGQSLTRYRGPHYFDVGDPNPCLELTEGGADALASAADAMVTASRFLAELPNVSTGIPEFLPGDSNGLAGQKAVLLNVLPPGTDPVIALEFPDRMDLAFDYPLRVDRVPAKEAFAVTLDGVAAAIESVSVLVVDPNAIRLSTYLRITLAESVKSANLAARVSYVPPEVNSLQRAIEGRDLFVPAFANGVVPADAVYGPTVPVFDAVNRTLSFGWQGSGTDYLTENFVNLANGVRRRVEPSPDYFKIVVGEGAAAVEHAPSAAALVWPNVVLTVPDTVPIGNVRVKYTRPNLVSSANPLVIDGDNSRVPERRARALQATFGPGLAIEAGANPALNIQRGYIPSFETAAVAIVAKPKPAPAPVSASVSEFGGNVAYIRFNRPLNNLFVGSSPAKPQWTAQNAAGRAIQIEEVQAGVASSTGTIPDGDGYVRVRCGPGQSFGTPQSQGTIGYRPVDGHASNLTTSDDATTVPAFQVQLSYGALD